MSKRGSIEMTDEDRARYVAQSQTIVLVSNGIGGLPHPMPMWFSVALDGAIHMTTYGRSQKVENLRRDPRVSLLVESGTEYEELCGVVLYGEAEIVDDLYRVLETMAAISGDDASVGEGMRKSASKRVMIRVKPERVVSWDHRKLVGGY